MDADWSEEVTIARGLQEVPAETHVCFLVSHMLMDISRDTVALTILKILMVVVWMTVAGNFVCSWMCLCTAAAQELCVTDCSECQSQENEKPNPSRDGKTGRGELQETPGRFYSVPGHMHLHSLIEWFEDVAELWTVEKDDNSNRWRHWLEKKSSEIIYSTFGLKWKN